MANDGVNPVERVLLSVAGAEGELFISTIRPRNNRNNGGDGQGGAAVAGHVEGEVVQANMNESIEALQHHVAGLEREVRETKVQIELFRNESKGVMTRISRNIHRMSTAPARIIGRGTAGSTGSAGSTEERTGPPATLSKNPRDLYVLWREFDKGLGGRKAARLFTARERGQVKATYYRRKVVWEAIATLIRAGRTAFVAIDLIYQSYGRNQSVTKIIGSMLRDRRLRGGHPNLRVGQVTARILRRANV